MTKNKSSDATSSSSNNHYPDRGAADDVKWATHCTDCYPGNCPMQVFVKDGKVLFDDFYVEEIIWQAENGNDLHIPWQASENAKWFRFRKSSFAFSGYGPDGAALGRPGVGFGVKESMRLILDFRNRSA